MVRTAWFVSLAVLSLTASYAVLTGGADDTGTFAVVVLSIGLAGLVGGPVLFQAAPASRAERTLNGLALAFLAYTALQLVPLPMAVLRLLSPERAEIADTLRSLTASSAFAPLSLAPPTTWIHLSRICAYAVVFFVVRQLVRRSPYGPWAPVLPLVAIGAMQAGWAMVTNTAAGGVMSGSYPNYNHFAGLLELVLPLAIGYSVSSLYGSGRRGVLALSDVVRGTIGIGLGSLMLIGVLVSGSKGGATACLMSLCFMGAVWFGGRFSGRTRWLFFAAAALLLVGALIFFIPATLVERFSSFASDQPTEGRVPVWRDTLRLIADYPLFGCGLGTFFPAFLRYQIAGAGWAWTNTHNDYLQLLAELGLVGFVAPATFVLLIFRRAVGAAASGDVRESTFIGLACAGSLGAILVHSFTDFNTYVTANGLVLAWVCGLAATLTPSARIAVPSGPPASRSIGAGMGPAVTGLAVLTSLYGGAWLAYLTAYAGQAAAERLFCRFGVCDTDGVLSSYRQPAKDPRVSGAGMLPSNVLLAYLDRDRAAPYRWDALATALAAAGRRGEARLAFARAVELGPTSVSTLLAAADFHFDDGHADVALTLSRRALTAGDGTVYEQVFQMLDDKHVPLTALVDGGTPDQPSVRALLQYASRGDHTDQGVAEHVWAWALASGYIDEALAREYLNGLLKAGTERRAWSAWTDYAKRKYQFPGYPDENRVFNGDFAQDPWGGPFDWQVWPTPGVSTSFEAGDTASNDGRRPRQLRLSFDGSHNIGDVGVEQRLYLEPGHYTLRARVRAEELSTDNGIVIRLECQNGEAQASATTKPISGTVAWTTIEANYNVQVGCGLTSLRFTRTPSLKFDRMLRGTLLVTALTLR